MRYFFSSPHQYYKFLLGMNLENYLLSFAVDAKNCHHFAKAMVMIDSGAFTAWNKGTTIDIEAYKAFCKEKPSEWIYINMDVIPTTGSSKGEIEKCCQMGYENYVYLKQEIPNLMPVFHYGDNIKWLEKYLSHNPPIVGISPANDTHENIKRDFLKKAFSVLDVKNSKIKTHGLGYSSFDGLFLFPFYSVDSISYKRVPYYCKNGKVMQLIANSKMYFLLEKNIKRFLYHEQLVTKVWQERGISWQ